MRCKYFMCENEATPGYPCCNSNHGVALKQNLETLPTLFDADLKSYLREFMTVEQAIHYSKCV